MHLVEGLTVSQSLRLAMLFLARRPYKQDTLRKDLSGALVCNDDVKTVRSDLNDQVGKSRPVESGSLRREGAGAVPNVLSFVRPFIEMLQGVEHSSTARCAPASHTHAIYKDPQEMHREEQEREIYWREFCRRVVAPTCVFDFPYADTGGLNLFGDNRLLERMYCFEDRHDDWHLLVGGKRRRVILKVRTLRKWGDRGNELFLLADKVTSAKVIYAYFDPTQQQFIMETGPEGLKLLPVSEHPRERWQDSFQNGRCSEIEWQWRTQGSLPSFENKDAAGQYDDVRAAIRMGEDSLFSQGATTESINKNPNPWHRKWIECDGISSTNSMLRNNTESIIECKVYLRKYLLEASEAWTRPMHWAAFLVFGANTCLPHIDNGRQRELASSHETTDDLVFPMPVSTGSGCEVKG